MKKYFILFIFFFIITLPVASFAEQALVPQSGQTVCYDAAGVEIPCTGTGQDGDQQMGIAWPNPRFTDNNNGTITDNLTGLIWLKNANCFGSDWTTALTSANTLASGSCGLTDGSVAGDWRLPNKNELMSLSNNRQQDNSATWLNTNGFSNLQSYYYWSSTTNVNYTSYVWVVYMPGSYFFYAGKSNGFYVLPVRGGQ